MHQVSASKSGFIIIRFSNVFSLWLPLLTVSVVWGFLPDLAAPFVIKGAMLQVGVLILVFSRLSHDFIPWKVPGGSVGIGGLLWFVGLVLSGISVCIYTDPTNWWAAYQGIAQFVPLALLLLVIVSTTAMPSDLERLELAVVMAASGVALLALKQLLLPDWLDPGFYARGKMRAYSTLGNPNLSAFVLVAALPLAWWRSVRAAGWIRQTLYGCMVLLVLGLMATQSKQAFLALAIASGFGAIWLGPKEKALRHIWLLTALVVLSAAFLASAVLLGWLPVELSHTVQARALIGFSAILQLLQHPIAGVGIDRFEIYHPAAQAWLLAGNEFAGLVANASAARDAHNDFLHWGAVTGLFGIAGFTILCGASAVQGWRSNSLRLQHAGRYIALLACILYMWTTAVMPHPGTALVFVVILGLVLRECPSANLADVWVDLRKRSQGSASSYPRALSGRTLSMVIVSAMLLAASTMGFREWRAQLAEGRAERLMTQRDVWLAEQIYREAISWSALNGKRLKNHAVTLLLLQDRQGALAELSRSSLYSGDPGIALLKAEIHTSLGDYGAAIPIYQGLVASFPELMTPRFVLGQIYVQQGRIDLAAAQFQRVVDIRPQPLNQYITQEKVALQKKLAQCFLDGGCESEFEVNSK